MYPLTVADASILVRARFDEQGINDSDMVYDQDSSEFEELLAKTLPEAINAVHSSAPVQLLNGMTLSNSELIAVHVDQNEKDVVCFGITKELLRLVAFKSVDSPYVVSELVPEYSAEGRMQLNPYTRGTYDMPRLVLCQGKANVYTEGGAGAQKVITFNTNFRYYSLKEEYTGSSNSVMDKVEKFEYIPRCKYSANTTTYHVAENVYENVLDQLAGMMLAIYNDNRATYFLQKASFQPAMPQMATNE